MGTDKEKAIALIQMPEVQLLSLLEFECQVILKEELKIVEDWIKNKRCKCAEHLNIQNKINSLDCKHLNSKLDKNLGEKNKSLEFKSKKLIERNLYKGMQKLNRTSENR